MTTPQKIQRSTHCVEDTFALGQEIGKSLTGGLTIGLAGPLGAGKTQLVKGIASGNGFTDDREVTSPTFTLINEYPGQLVLYHLDAYRLNSSAELQALGFDELMRHDSVVIVEWADRVISAMPDDRIWFEITPTSEQDRNITLTAYGETASIWLASVQIMNR